MIITSALSALLALIFVKASVVIAAGFAAHAATQRSASRTVAQWIVAAVALGVMPAVSLAIPSWTASAVDFPHAIVRSPKLWVACWGAGVFWMLVRVLRDYRAASALVRTARPLENPRVLVIAQRTISARAKRSVALLVVDGLRTPAVVGVRGDTILLPADIGLWRDDEIEGALTHESAHIAAHDALITLAERVLCAFYWPNPLVHMAVRVARRQRELAADDAVVNTGTDAGRYATCMIRIARASRATRGGLDAPRGAMAFAGRAGLDQRIHALFDERRDRDDHRRRSQRLSWSVVAALTAITGSASFWVCVA